MYRFIQLFIGLAVILGFVSCKVETENLNEQVNTDSIRAVALKEWKDMKFGMFIHWGVYSVPAGVWNGEQIEKLGEQIQRHAYIPHNEYIEIAKQFNPVNFNADSIVLLAKNTGMNYIVLTAKHHDGFCMYDSEHTDFDIIETSPYGKDILKMLAESCQKYGLKLGIYYSTPDWHFNGPNPEVNPDDGKISVFGKVSKENEDYQVKHLTELLSNYGDIVELFFDMGEPTKAQSARFAETVHAIQPKCVINGRIMNNEGDFLTMPDNHVPDTPVDTLAWETPGTFYHTWGYKSWVKGAPIKQQVKKQIHKLARIVARGGNFLLNIGPKADGSVAEYEKDVLRGIGNWVKTYGDAIYHTNPTPFENLAWGECTQKDNKLYLFVMDWPKNNKLMVPGLKNEIESVKSLSVNSTELSIEKQGNNKIIDLSTLVKDEYLTVIELTYKGALEIEKEYTVANEKGNLLIQGNNCIKHGKYGRESYRSILKDYYRTWNIEAKTKGLYDVYLTYRMVFDEKDFVFELNQKSLAFKLNGEGTVKAKAETIDGNEQTKKVMRSKAKGKFKRVHVGTIEVEKAGKSVLYLKQGQEFDFKATQVEFKKQDPKYRIMKLDIETIELIRK